MRMTSDNFNELARRIGLMDTDLRRELYRLGEFNNSDKVKDLNKRYRWDLFWEATGPTFESSERWNLTEGLNDAHIDTALRNIVAPL